MSRRDVRNVVAAVLWGSFMSALVCVFSVLLGAPRLLPGCVFSFLIGSAQAWLFLDRASRGGAR